MIYSGICVGGPNNGRELSRSDMFAVVAECPDPLRPLAVSDPCEAVEFTEHRYVYDELCHVGFWRHEAMEYPRQVEIDGANAAGIEVGCGVVKYIFGRRDIAAMPPHEKEDIARMAIVDAVRAAA